MEKSSLVADVTWNFLFYAITMFLPVTYHSKSIFSIFLSELIIYRCIEMFIVDFLFWLSFYWENCFRLT